MTIPSAAAGLEGTGFSVPTRVPRQRSLRGLERQATRQTLETLAAGVVDAFGDTSCCGACGGAAKDFASNDGALPDGWERRETTWQQALGPLPEGFEVRLEAESAANATAPLFVESPPKLSVNTVNFFEYELTTTDTVPTRRYGPLAELVADLGALGVQIVRHPGRVQLMLDEVLIDHMVPVSATVSAVPFSLADATALDEAVQASPVLARILDLVTELRAQNVELQLIITMITLGGGGGTAAVPVLSIDDDGDGIETTYTHAIPCSWTDEWRNQVVYDDLADMDQPFNRATAAGDPSLAEWDARTLDPRNPAKRAFYRNFARAIGRWLQAHEADLADVLAGIEICNEAEIRQVIRQADGVLAPDGEAWGWLYYSCASALREECDWVPMWLPSIASYAPDATEGALSWDGKVNYLRRMLQAIEGLRITDVVLDAFGVVRPRFERWELVDGLDYHWYHRAQSAKVEPKDPGDRQLLLWLPLELAELRRALDVELFEDVQLSVTESAVNVLCHDDAADRTWGAGYPAGCEAGAVITEHPPPDYRPPLVECPAGVPLTLGREAPSNAFQAAMVWMRILAALVGGARIAGWHTHVARLPTSSFAATGLRQDLHANDAGIENAGARASWYALRRLVELMATVTAVRLAWPALPVDRDSFKTRLGMGLWADTELVWVVELENASHFWRWTGTGDTIRPLGLGSTGWWAYVLFIDGTAGVKDPVTVPACATVSLRADLGTDLYRVTLEPSSLVSGTGSAGSFPAEVWTLGPVEHVERSGRYSGLFDRYDVRVGLGQWPVLLLSTASLEVAEVTVGGTLA